MVRALKICVVHGCPHVVVAASRCQEHAAQRRAHQKRTTPTHIAGAKWSERKKREAAVRAWRRTHGDWCPGYKVPAHTATDLTAEHSHALGEGGHLDQELTVLCRSCNSRHGAETANLLRRP